LPPQCGSGLDAGTGGILMKPVSKIAAAKTGITQAVQSRQFLLGFQTCEGKCWMCVSHVPNDLLFRDGFEGIQGNQVLAPGVQVLKPVHVIGQRHRRISPRFGFAEKIPGGPGSPIGGHPACVRMQIRFVDTVHPGTEQTLFRFRWIFQQSKGLVGVSGNEDPVEAAAMAAGISEEDTVRSAANRSDICAGLHLAVK